VRSGDVLQALIVFFGTSIGLSIRQFAAIAVGMAVLWLLIAWRLFREHKRQEKEYLESVPVTA
jgi:AAA family ATP:ADP antiporter